MFELVEAIPKWREQMAAEGLNRAGVLDELEAHLRDDIEQRMRAGLAEEEAFTAATRAMGDAEALQSEFEKVLEQLAAGDGAPGPIPPHKWFG